MTKLTYKEAYDKIIAAYFRDEIKPMCRDFCFCGTLENNTHNWIKKETCVNLNYSFNQYKEMENAILVNLTEFGIYRQKNGGWFGTSCPELSDDQNKYEELLFKGMCDALEVLKEIHKSRGENVDGDFSFKKRKLSKADNQKL